MANNGNRGKFSDRIKKISFDKWKKRKNINLEDTEIMYKNFLKVVAVIPLIVVDNIFDKSNVSDKKQIVAEGKTYLVDKEREHIVENKQRPNIREEYLQKKKINRQKIENIDVSLIKNKQNEFLTNINNKERENFKETNIVNNRHNNAININVLDNGINEKTSTVNNSDLNNFDNASYSDVKDAKKLEKQIIDLIKKDLVKIVNELEIYESELYILNEINNDERTLDECRKNIAEVKKILSKIEQIKSKYDFLKDNYDFEYLLEINNAPLIDKIIELKNMFDNNEVKATVNDYKLLDVYKSLYLKVDDIYEKTYKIEEEKLKKEEELKKRDIDFNKLKDNVYDVNKFNTSYAYFIEQQNLLLNELSTKISKIDSKEIVNIEMKGYGKYLGASLKYLGLLMLSPLRGLFPSIAGQTIVAKNAVSCLRKGITFEEHRKTVYESIDYSSAINSAINDLDSTDRMVDSTLDDLIKLKVEYSKKFKEYQGDFLEYRDVINKIDSLQEAMINNKIKIEIMKTKMKQYNKQNEDKMQLVKKLNEKENEKKN